MIEPLDPVDTEPKTTAEMLRSVLIDNGQEMDALMLKREVRRRYGVRVERTTIYNALARMIGRNEVAAFENDDRPRTFLAVPTPAELKAKTIHIA